MLTTAELASMRTTAGQFLPEPGTVSRPTNVTDNQGGFTASYVAAATVSCRIMATGGSEGWLQEQAQAAERYTLTVPVGTNLSHKDRMLSGGRTYEVVAIKDKRSFEVVERVDAVVVN